MMGMIDFSYDGISYRAAMVEGKTTFEGRGEQEYEQWARLGAAVQQWRLEAGL